MNQQPPKAGMKFNEPLSYREQVAIDKIQQEARSEMRYNEVLSGRDEAIVDKIAARNTRVRSKSEMRARSSDDDVVFPN